MIRIAARAVLALIANAVALVVTSLLLSQMGLDASGFITAVVIFTVVAIVIEPLIRQTAVRSAPAVIGSTTLVATFISLAITAAVADGLSISGALTWVMATVLVWVIALVARLLLPLVIFKNVLAEAREARG